MITRREQEKLQEEMDRMTKEPWPEGPFNPSKWEKLKAVLEACPYLDGFKGVLLATLTIVVVYTCWLAEHKARVRYLQSGKDLLQSERDLLESRKHYNEILSNHIQWMDEHLSNIDRMLSVTNGTK